MGHKRTSEPVRLPAKAEMVQHDRDPCFVPEVTFYVRELIAGYLVLGGILQPHTLKPSRSLIPHSSAADVPGLWFGEDAQASRA